VPSPAASMTTVAGEVSLTSTCISSGNAPIIYRAIFSGNPDPRNGC
jgi:hypothetical protein